MYKNNLKAPENIKLILLLVIIFLKEYIYIYLNICACLHDKSLQSYRTLSTLWTVAHQVPLFMGFSRQEYWSGLPCPPSEDRPNPGIKLTSACVSCIAGRLFTHWATWEAQGMSTDSNILAWRVPWTEEPGGLQSMGLQRAGHDWVTSPSWWNVI